jgi:hypothetical protein
VRSVRFITLLATAFVLMVLSACTPDSGVPTTLASTSTSAVSTTTTTTEGTTTTTGSSTTTTTETVPADTYVTVGNTCLLGWWDGAWQTGDDPPVSGGEEYQVVRLVDPLSTSVGSAPGPHCDPLDLVSVAFDPPIPGDFLEIDALAVQTGGNVRPHEVEMLGLSLPAYVEATADLMATRVDGTPEVNLTQVIRTDLEGDGVDEVIVAATTIPEDWFTSEVGDYSIVYLRKLIEGEVQTAILGVSVIEDLDDLLSDLVVFEVSAVTDLNGDGRMEIVLNGTVWEGAFLQAWEYVNDDLGPVEALVCGCGS